ncbi:hypothetical protein [Paraburkholderia sp. J10-1]|uniref:hypothetical protein n=1 Tax=Paraburkholderia sp. J10-1 TaxID=2805430 RepID=UPI002AB767A2|nr:hypothetical protein [Paraburkholderia sp. J10-1]
MTERPILFSASMVRAIIEGRKTQTRRVTRGTALDWLQPGMFTPEYVASPGSLLSPYGFARDRLWLRETFFAFGRWETRHNAKKGRDEWHFVDMTHECDRAYQYAADNSDVPVTSSRHGGATPSWWKRPAIHMPRRASRLTLEITGVHVARLQDISEADAIAEGVERDGEGWRSYTGGSSVEFATTSYASLWDSLNATRGFGWDVNPWVWVVTFTRASDQQ